MHRPLHGWAAGFYQSPGWRTKHPRIQVLTVGALLSDTRVDIPPVKHTNVTFRRAPKSTKADSEAIELQFEAPPPRKAAEEPAPYEAERPKKGQRNTP